MKEITDSLLKECAKNIMIELNDEEFNQLKEDFIMVSDELSKIGKIEGIEDVIMVFLAGLYSQNKMVSYTVTYNSKTFNWQGKIITDYIVERKK